MKIEVHILTCDADWVLPWTLRHYGSFADRVVVHDGGPDWREGSLTRELCRCHGALWREWDTAGELNDELAARHKNLCWRGTDADWVITADADELLYFPGNKEGYNHHARTVLEDLLDRGAAVIKPHGFEMFSETPPEGGSHQIYDDLKSGAPDDEWYSKPILFSPRLVAESGLGIGAHESRPVLKNGMAFRVGREWPKSNPPVYLLHYHQIGPIEAVAARYDATRKRLAAVNVRNGWGNFEPGLDHARRKRARIFPNLTRIIP